MTRCIVAATVKDGHAALDFAYVNGDTDEDAIRRYASMKGQPDAVMVLAGSAAVRQPPKVVKST